MAKQIHKFEGMTLKEAKEALLAVLDDGADCPCCNRFAKMYRRPMTSAMAYGLILIYKEFEYSYGSDKHLEWLHLEQFFKTIDVPASIRGDLPKLRWWGLIQPRGEEHEDGNPNDGFYKITETGKKFVQKLITVPGKVKLYDNRFFGYCEKSPDVDIIKALGTKFNYEELMK